MLLLAAGGALGGGGHQRAYVAQIQGDIDGSTVAFVRHAVNVAQRHHADTIIFEIDSSTGSLSDAIAIDEAISQARLRSVAFINSRATGAAALIALGCEHVAVARGSVWGDAPPASFSDKPKLRQVWGEFRHVASKWGRNTEVAAAMVQARRNVNGLGVEGRPLTLEPSDAMSLGMADFIADDHAAVARNLRLGGPISDIRPCCWSTAVRIITNPWITVLLLAIGVSLLIREAMTWRHFGVLGTVGLAVTVIVLLANISAGGSWAGVVLFAIGILSLFAEIYLAPGLGLPTLVGIVCIFLGVFWGIGGGRATIIPAVLGAIVTSMVGLFAFFACLPHTASWKNLLQLSSDDRDLGIVAPNDFTGYFGVVGLALTELRPKGLAGFAGSRLDVVADGNYVRQGSSIEVGSRFLPGRRSGFGCGPLLQPTLGSAPGLPTD